MTVENNNLANLHFNDRGNWDNTSTYIAEDYVLYNNSYYFAVQDVPADSRPYPMKEIKHTVTYSSGFQFDGASTDVIWNRGERHILDCSSSTLNDYPCTFVLANGHTGNLTTSGNEYSKGIKYYLDGRSVGPKEFGDLNSWKNSEKRFIEVLLDYDVNSLKFLYGHAITVDPGGSEHIAITIQGNFYWKMLKETYKFREFTPNSGTTYYVGDMVTVEVPTDTSKGTVDLMNNRKIQANGKTAFGSYYCHTTYTTTGITEDYPWYNTTSSPSKWTLINRTESYSTEVDKMTKGGREHYYDVQIKVVDGVNKFSLNKGRGRDADFDEVTPVIYAGRGDTIYFDLTHASNMGNPMAIGPNADNDSTAYGNTEGVTFHINGDFYTTYANFETALNGLSGQQPIVYMKYDIPDNLNAAITTLYYFSGASSGLGGSIKIAEFSSVESTLGAFTGNHLELIFPYNEGIIGDTNQYYQKTGQYTRKYSHDWYGAINGAGGLTNWGSDSDGGQGLSAGSDGVSGGCALVFDHLDWWRSTDNGGTGVHSTPDGEVPKVIQAEGGYRSGMCLMNSGEVYHWGYGGHGQSGDASTSTRYYPAHVGGSYQNVYLAANTNDHVWRDTRIKRICHSGKGSEPNTHSCYAIDENGELWSWGYNGYGQLGKNTTSNGSPETIPHKIDKASYFNGNTIEGVWADGQEYTAVYAVDSTGKLYSWGYNGYGQLGHGGTSNQSVPTEITTPVFDDSNAGKIVKVCTLGNGSYGNIAILTSKGQIWCAGYMGNSGIALQGNTSQQNNFVRHQTGPGSNVGTIANSAVNMWLAGTAHQASIFMVDGQGYLYCAGANGFYQLGIGNSVTPQLIATQPQWDINGVRSLCKNVRGIWSHGHENQDEVCCYLLTERGFVFVAGANERNNASVGFTSTYCNASVNDSNGIEMDNGGYFVMPRLHNDMQGNCSYIQPHGFGDGDTEYWGTQFFSYDNRMSNGGDRRYCKNGHIGFWSSHINDISADYPYLM